MNYSYLQACILGILTAALCAYCQPRVPLAPSTPKYQTINYVEVGKMLPRVKAPYVIDVKNGAKRLIFIGCEHVREVNHPQFAQIENYFKQVKPQITFNEGGQVHDSVHFRSLPEAILKNGETGCLKYLSDQAAIKMINGDLSAQEEFAFTLKKHPKDQLFLYYVMERFVIPHLYGADGNQSFEQVYSEQVPAYFMRNKFPLTKDEQDIMYFKKLYQQYVGIPFKAELNDKIEQFDYLNPDCYFCEIGRTSKIVRDSVLLSKIDQALDTHDRVMVTFGHGHALALGPALTQIIQKKRK